MAKTTKSTELIAEWTIDQDSSVDPPRTVRWGDGSAATHDDYLTHMVDTHTWVRGINRMELRMYPDIIADLNFSHAARTWVISGVDITPAALGITDAEAPDDQIIAELYTHYPIVYGLGFIGDRSL